MKVKELVQKNINPKNAEDIYKVLSESNDETIKLAISLMNGFQQQSLLFSILEYIESTPKEWSYDGLKFQFDGVLNVINKEK